jgi:hypothetical protein
MVLPVPEFSGFSPSKLVQTRIVAGGQALMNDAQTRAGQALRTCVPARGPGKKIAKFDKRTIETGLSSA